MGLEQTWFESGGHRLWGEFGRARSLCPGALTFVLSHGLTNSHADAPVFDVLSAELLNAGHDIFSFDYFGSGASEGLYQDKTFSELRLNLGSALELVQETVRTGPRSIALFGRSVGATLSAFYAKDPRVCCSVLGSAPLDLVATFMPTYTTLSPDGFVYLNPSFMPSGQIHGEYRLRQAFYDELPSLTKDLKSAIRGARRVLVLQGSADEKQPAEQSRRLFNLLEEPKSYRVFEGMRHDYGGYEREVTEVVIKWVTSLRNETL